MSLDVGRLVLVRGSNHPGKGFSAMEAVAFAAGEAWSERPRCASPAVTEWMIAWNDGLDEVSRQTLRRYIWRLVGSRGTRAQERSRQWMAADWLVRWYAPRWLRAAGLRGHAARLTRLRPVRCEADVIEVWPTVRAASRAARVERDMAWRSAASVVPAHDWGTAGAVWSATSDATWGTAGSAARAVVWSTADPTAPGRVEAPIWDAACDAAADAAGALAWAAVRDAARRPAPAVAPVAPVTSVAPVTVVAPADPAPAPVHARGSGRTTVPTSVPVVHDAGRSRPSIDPLAAGWQDLTVPAGPISPAAGVPLPGLVGVGSAGGPVVVAGGLESGGFDPTTHLLAATAEPAPPVDGGIGVGEWVDGIATVDEERRDSNPAVETESDVAMPTRAATDDMEEPHALAEADDPNEADDMWQLAWETAGEVLAPTSAALQAAAHDLVDRMLAVTE